MADTFEIGKTYVWGAAGSAPFVVLGRGIKDPSKVYVEYLKCGSMEVHWDDQFNQFKEYVPPRTMDAYIGIIERANGTTCRVAFDDKHALDSWARACTTSKLIGSKKVTLTEGEFITDG